MASNLTFKHHHWVASQVKESLDESTGTSMYLVIGLKGVELGSNVVVNTLDFEQRNWANVEFAKRVTANDVEFVVPRVAWATGQTYNIYTSAMTTSNSNCFVITSDNQVYACINNNSSGVTGTLANSQPSSTGTTPETMSEDSYIWQYLYTVNSAKAAKFIDTGSVWMPALVDATLSAAKGRGNLGYNPPNEMKASRLMFNVRIFGDEGGNAFVGDKYCMRGIVVDPLDTATNAIAVAATYEQGNANATALLTANTGDLIYAEYTNVDNTRDATQVDDIKIVVEF